MDEMTIEQRRAVAIAGARLRLQQQTPTEVQPTETAPEQAPERSFLGSLGRQAGLTARAGLTGLAAIPAIVGDVAGLDSSGAVQRLASAIGLPEPANPTERVAGMAASTLTGVGGLARGAAALATRAGATAKPFLQTLAQQPGVQTTAAATGGTASGIAQESGADPLTNLGVTLVASALTPTGVNLAKATGRLVSNASATTRAAFGSKAGIQHLENDLFIRSAGPERKQIIDIFQNAEKQIPGVKPTSSDVLARANMKLPEQVGGRLIRMEKDLSGAAGVEDVLPSVRKGQNVALRKFRETVEQVAKKPREAALDRANANGGVNIKPVKDEIAAILGEPGLGDSKLVKKVLAAVDADLDGITIATNASGAPLVNSKALYTIRKEMNNTIRTNSKETGNFDKRLSAKLETSIRLKIDDAIEASGGTGWKSYLKKFSVRLKRAEAFEEARFEAKRISAKVKGSSGQLGSAEIPKLPTLLHRPMMFLNFALKTIGRDANEPLVKAATQTLQNPKAIAAILKRPPTDPIRMKFMDILRQAAIVATITARQVEEQETQQPPPPRVPQPANPLRGINSALPPGPAAPRSLPQPQSFVRG